MKPRGEAVSGGVEGGESEAAGRVVVVVREGGWHTNRAGGFP